MRSSSSMPPCLPVRRWQTTARVSSRGASHRLWDDGTAGERRGSAMYRRRLMRTVVVAVALLAGRFGPVGAPSPSGGGAVGAAAFVPAQPTPTLDTTIGAA